MYFLSRFAYLQAIIKERKNKMKLTLFSRCGCTL